MLEKITWNLMSYPEVKCFSIIPHNPSSSASQGKEIFPLAPCSVQLCRRYPFAQISFLICTDQVMSIYHPTWCCKRRFKYHKLWKKNHYTWHCFSKDFDNKIHRIGHYVSNLRSFAKRFLLTESSIMPSLIDLPNSFQNFAYWPFFSSSLEFSTSASIITPVISNTKYIPQIDLGDKKVTP